MIYSQSLRNSFFITIGKEKGNALGYRNDSSTHHQKSNRVGYSEFETTYNSQKIHVTNDAYFPKPEEEATKSENCNNSKVPKPYQYVNPDIESIKREMKRYDDDIASIRSELIALKN